MTAQRVRPWQPAKRSKTPSEAYQGPQMAGAKNLSVKAFAEELESRISLSIPPMPGSERRCACGTGVRD